MNFSTCNDLTALTGNKDKGEKDTKMTRDFQGDLFYMEIWVDDVVCKRTYERIKDEE